jgi:hypothetical protein
MLPEASYEMFGTVWSSFVMFHDLAYPLEQIRVLSRSERSEFIEPYSHLFSSFLRDLALKSLSNLLVAYAVVRSEIVLSLGDLYLASCETIFVDRASVSSSDLLSLFQINDSTVERSVDAGPVKEVWGSARHLPKLQGHRFKSVLSFVQDQNICAVLEDQATGMPILIVLGRHRDAPILWFDSEADRPKKLSRISSRSVYESAFGAQSSLGTGLVWQYFGRELDEQIDSLLESIFGEHVDRFAVLAKKFIATADIAPETLNVLSSGGDASFRCFWELRGLYLNDDEGGFASDDIEGIVSAIENSLTTISGEVPKILGRAVEESFKQASGQGELKISEILMTKPLDEALKTLLKHLDSVRRDEIAKSVQSSLGSRIQQEVAYERALKLVRGTMDAILSKPFEGVVVRSIGLNSRKIDEDFSLDKAFSEDEVPTLSLEVSNRLKNVGLPSLFELMKVYKPGHAAYAEGGDKDAPRSGKFIDHGLGSAAVAVTLSYLFEEIVRLVRDEDQVNSGGARLLRLALLVDSRSSFPLIEFESSKLLAEAAVAITLHNLYPEALKPQYTLKTKSSIEPFSYLAMLVDGLQRWDRERQLNQSFGELPPGVSGGRYDIQIEGDVIVVSVIGRGVNLRQEEKKLRDSLADYLEGADKLIRLRLLER